MLSYTGESQSRAYIQDNCIRRYTFRNLGSGDFYYPALLAGNTSWETNSGVLIRGPTPHGLDSVACVRRCIEGV